MKQKKLSAWTIVSACIFILGMAMLTYSILFGQKVERRLETVVVLREVGKYTDLPNKEQGTVVVALRAADSEIDVGETTPSRVQLFRSKLVEGLAIDYLYEEKYIVSGIPKLKSAEVSLFDGNLHQVAYTFKRGEKQQLYFDGQLMAEGEYNPATKLTITGFLVKLPENEVKESVAGTSVVIYDRAMSEEEIRAMQESS